MQLVDRSGSNGILQITQVKKVEIISFTTGGLTEIADGCSSVSEFENCSKACSKSYPWLEYLSYRSVKK